jgi:hypothetical protein
LRAAGIDDQDVLTAVIDGEVTLGERYARSLPDMLKIGHAAWRLQQEAMRRAGASNPQGKRYRDKWDELAPQHLRNLDRSERKRFIWVWENRERLEEWYATVLAANQHFQWKWNNPLSVQNHFTKWMEVTHGEQPQRRTTKRHTLHDSVTELQEKLDEAQTERDDLRIRLADYEGEQEPEPVRVRGENFWLDPIRDVVTYCYNRDYERCREFIAEFNKYHRTQSAKRKEEVT